MKTLAIRPPQRQRLEDEELERLLRLQEIQIRKEEKAARLRAKEEKIRARAEEKREREAKLKREKEEREMRKREERQRKKDRLQKKRLETQNAWARFPSDAADRMMRGEHPSPAEANAFMKYPNLKYKVAECGV
jgi:hypothetical protein